MVISRSVTRRIAEQRGEASPNFCYLCPSVGTRQVNIGDDAGPVIRWVCDDHYDPE